MMTMMLLLMVVMMMTAIWISLCYLSFVLFGLLLALLLSHFLPLLFVLCVLGPLVDVGRDIDQRWSLNCEAMHSCHEILNRKRDGEEQEERGRSRRK